MRDLAVALCRVSTPEQEENNSLATQQGNVAAAADMLGVTIPVDAIWSGHVSSKKGVNFNRKDLLEIYAYCKRNPRVRYLIVQEVDRFMRSPDEQTYWIVRLRYELGVTVYFADKPELNEDTHNASLMRYMDGWRAGGSNEERIRKSITGATSSMKDGKYPFRPKLAYMKGRRKAIPEIHPVKGPMLRRAFLKIINYEMSPTKALAWLNMNHFGGEKYILKMDKFRTVCEDPFYAGYLEMDKQVKISGKLGLHEPLITYEQHLKLVETIRRNKKNQSGPLKDGNPLFPLNNIVHCAKCVKSPNGRYVGFKHGNGKSDKIWYKYRCRSCGTYISREELHEKAAAALERYLKDESRLLDMTNALEVAWSEQKNNELDEITRLEKLVELNSQSIREQAVAAIKPENSTIRDEILDSIKELKEENALNEEMSASLKSSIELDKDTFLAFALDFISNLGANILELNKPQILRCKQLLFPSGFVVDDNKKVYTPEVSIFYRLGDKKTDTSVSEKVSMVRVRRL